MLVPSREYGRGRSPMISALLLILPLLSGGLTKNAREFNILDSSKYLKLDEIYQFLHKIHEIAKPALELKVLGNTRMEEKDFQNDIHLVTIGNKKAPVIFFDCGIHAREWISPAACLFLIQKLASLFHNKPKKTIKKKNPILRFQWQFIPMLNPDGYYLSHTIDRMYRKNARPYNKTHFSDGQLAVCSCSEDINKCRGVDLNRNLPAGWGEGSARFARESGYPCFEMFRGPHPISEPETKVLDKHVTSLGNQVIGAFSIHSYGQEIYHPKGWLVDKHAEQIKGKDRSLLEDFADYINEHINFGVGNVDKLLGSGDLEGGTTDDYYYTNKNINVTYTIELDPHVDNFDVGFELADKKIKEVGQKMWKTLQLMANKFDEMYPEE